MRLTTPLILFIFIASAVFLSSGSLFAQPKLSIPESIFNFGYVPQNSKISHVFWLHSTGADSLKIEKVSPG
jgi:hypothetical protein